MPPAELYHLRLMNTPKVLKRLFVSYSSLNEKVMFLETVIFVKAEGFMGKRTLYLIKYPRFN